MSMIPGLGQWSLLGYTELKAILNNVSLTQVVSSREMRDSVSQEVEGVAEDDS